uniref:Uncharacterized protein MANES_06G099300 n=1 Tax=Rhizophora mucronata TaxID=61149 RepID=A0A2P2Q7S5_RHIMU
MADSEKLTALKKAYADIILNTAKEAAARIMASERKAQRYQQELFAAKDEALRMLLRLKQMLDSKVNEAEMMSWNQQRKIDELEAQLGEAEDIVKDLRTELRQLQDEFEMLTHNEERLLGEQIVECGVATQETALEENGPNTHGCIVSSPASAQCDLNTVHEVKNSNSNGMLDGTGCCSENKFVKDDSFVYNPDLASIMMRNKEPELHKNGCTQRIRASETNLLDGNQSLSGQDGSEKNMVFMGEEKEDKSKRKKLATIDNNVLGVESSKVEEKVKPEGDNYVHIHAAGSFRKNRKRATRYKEHRVTVFKDFSNEGEKVPLEEDPGTIKQIAQKDSEILLAPKSPSNANKMIVHPVSEEAINSPAECLRTCTKNKDEFLIDELNLTRQEAGSKEISEFPESKADLELASNLLVNSNPEESNTTEVLHPQPTDNKFLKYTFKRKRKKETPSSPDGDSSLDSSTLKRQMEETQICIMQSQDPGLSTDTPRDSRRVAQVARQLISLSEKKWR